MPLVGKTPHVGLNPYAPQNDAGRNTELCVWVPSATGIMPAPTAAAEPLEDPPGVRAGLCGLQVGPGLPMANSVVTVLPRKTVPDSRRPWTQAASRRGCQPA